MKIYFAPLEGITTNIYRDLHQEMFGMCDEYFAPFITPTENERLTAKSMKTILPQNNSVKLRVQCLANNGKAFVNFTEKAMEIGYDEVNLNLGCPSGTVVSNGRGAGALRDLDWLDGFLNEIFSYSKTQISIKTRAGFYSHDEFSDILKVYNKYPLEELVVHPRIREDFYNNLPNRESFDLAYRDCGTKLCYNGDICTAEDYLELVSRYPELNAVMIGRGAVKNPAVFREIRSGKKLSADEAIRFSNELEKRYLELLKSDINTLYKLKEVWVYMQESFSQDKKLAKEIKKAKNLKELNYAIEKISR